jgi:ABC-2 type transport system permease protein
MTRMFQAELLKLRRRRVAATVAVGAVLSAALSTVLVFTSATGPGQRPSERGATVASLSQPGGATEAFAIGASFVGILTLVLFIANVGGELSQGTMRTLLMRQPRRISLLAGKIAALLVFVAAVLALTEVLTVVASLAMAPTQDISTASWFGIDGLGDAARDYAYALLGLSAWALFGTVIAILVRSVPIGLAIGIVWSGPFEHIVSDSWTGAKEWFPGLLLEALAAGGTAAASVSRALVIVGAYVAIAVTAAAVLFARRDVTA